MSIRRGRHLLLDEGHGEQRREIVRADRLTRARMQRRLQRLGQPGQALNHDVGIFSARG